MLTKKKCKEALEQLDLNCWGCEYACDMSDDKPCVLKEIIGKLIDEHFDNPPLKFEELKPNMWVWDNKYKHYIKIRRLRKGRCFTGYYPNFEVNPETDELYDNLQSVFFFDENRFYRKQVQEDER